MYNIGYLDNLGTLPLWANEIFDKCLHKNWANIKTVKIKGVWKIDLFTR